MDKEEFQLLVNFHKDNKRQGPGSSRATKRALSFLGMDEKKKLEIADIGCGTGSQTITLAKNTNSHITAVDLSYDFLEKLKTRAGDLNLDHQITTRENSMDNLPFETKNFDIIWSEGAIYIMGFENGIRYWKKFLKNEGYLVVSDICWFTNSRPLELEKYWNQEDVEISTPAQKLQLFEENGCSPIAYFQLPEYCWLKEYYKPIEDNFQSFLAAHNYSKTARAIVDQMKQEIEMYNKYKKYYGYGFFIAKKRRSY